MDFALVKDTVVGDLKKTQIRVYALGDKNNEDKYTAIIFQQVEKCKNHHFFIFTL